MSVYLHVPCHHIKAKIGRMNREDTRTPYEGEDGRFVDPIVNLGLGKAPSERPDRK